MGRAEVEHYSPGPDDHRPQATDWQHQNRKQPDPAKGAQSRKTLVNWAFIDLQLRHIVVRRLSQGGGGSQQGRTYDSVRVVWAYSTNDTKSVPTESPRFPIAASRV